MCNYNYDIYNTYIYYYYYLKFLPGIMMCSNVWKSDPQFTTTNPGSPWALPILLGVSAMLVFIFPERLGHGEQQER